MHYIIEIAIVPVLIIMSQILSKVNNLIEHHTENKQIETINAFISALHLQIKFVALLINL